MPRSATAAVGKRTEDKIRGLIDFISTGDRPEYVVSTLRDLETFARAEKAELDRLVHDAQAPLRLPSIEEVIAQVRDLNTALSDNAEEGRDQLRTVLKNGIIRVGTQADGAVFARGDLLPLVILCGPRRAFGKRKITGDAISNDFTLLSRCSGGRI